MDGETVACKDVSHTLNKIKIKSNWENEESKYKGAVPGR
jgi:hypothetical protein